DILTMRAPSRSRCWGFDPEDTWPVYGRSIVITPTMLLHDGARSGLYIRLMSSPSKCRGRWVSRAVLGILLVFTAVLGSAPGFAEPPARMGTYVVDSAGVLRGDEAGRVRGAVDRLYTDHRVRLWVYYVEN